MALEKAVIVDLESSTKGVVSDFTTEEKERLTQYPTRFNATSGKKVVIIEGTGPTDDGNTSDVIRTYPNIQIGWIYDGGNFYPPSE